VFLQHVWGRPNIIEHVMMMWVTIWDGEGWVGVLFFCRGAGEDGQLGLGGFDNKDHVCRIEALSQIRVSSIVAGSRNSLAITEDGQVPVHCLIAHLFMLVKRGVQLIFFGSLP